MKVRTKKTISCLACIALGGFKAKHFLVVHLSGGTTELLEVRVHNHGFDIDMIGSSLDLHAGQFVDRIGVSLGLPFPSGPHLEELANNELESYDIKYYVKDLILVFQDQRLIYKDK